MFDAALPTFRLSPGTALAQSGSQSPPAVTLDAPALLVMTDLVQVRAATIHPSSTLHEAEQAMIHQGVRLLFVVTQMPRVEGLVTTTDLHGDQQMRAVHERGVQYADLCVADVMTGADLLDAVEHTAMATATVAQVVATLKRHGRNHVLVVDADPQGGRRLRGIVSRTQVERQIGMAITITPIASSFSEIERALL